MSSISFIHPILLSSFKISYGLSLSFTLLISASKSRNQLFFTFSHTRYFGNVSEIYNYLSSLLSSRLARILNSSPFVSQSVYFSVRFSHISFTLFFIFSFKHSCKLLHSNPPFILSTRFTALILILILIFSHLVSCFISISTVNS